MFHLSRSAGVLLLVGLLLGCARERGEETPASAGSAPTVKEGATVAWELVSSAFKNGEPIPAKYTGDGDNVSPPLAWTNPPEGTRELALVCTDPDSPSGSFTHWLLYGLSPGVTCLPENLPREASVVSPPCRQGDNDAGRTGYFGPSPPPGRPHRYQFVLYALATTTDLPPGADKRRVVRALEGKVLAKTMLEGLYGR